MPTVGVSALAISAIKCEILWAWLLRLASSLASAPGVSIRVTIGIECFAKFRIDSTACLWCSGSHAPFLSARFWPIKPTRRNPVPKCSSTSATYNGPNSSSYINFVVSLWTSCLALRRWLDSLGDTTSLI